MADLGITDWSDLQVLSGLDYDLEWETLRCPIVTTTQPEILESDLQGLPSLHYDSLDVQNHEIRLLFLHGPWQITSTDEANTSLIPTGSIRRVSLDSEPHYAALSYCWGDPSVKRQIFLDGCIVHVTENLYAALCQLQSADHELPLWIDALCINQTDNEEKSSQIPLMGRIYREAKVVVGWLGPEADGSDVAMKVLSYIGVKSLDLPDDQTRWEKRSELFNSIIPHPKHLDLAFPASEIVALLNRSWWTRIWIIQEVVLAPRVQVLCGSVSTQFDLLMLGFTLLYSARQVIANGHSLHGRYDAVEPVLRCDPRLVQAVARGRGQPFIPLKDRLLDMRGFHASVKHDYIYGMLGMVNDFDSLSIQINYDQTVAAAFTSVAKALLERQHNLPILSRVRFPKSVDDLPSWVPDWSHLVGAPMWTTDANLYSAGGRKGSRSIKFIGDNPIISGIDCDEVAELGPTWSDNQLKTGFEDLRTILRDIEKFASGACSGYHSKPDLEEAIIRTPIMDRETFSGSVERDRQEIRATASSRTAFTALMSGKRALLNLASEFSYRAHALAALESRRFFATKKGLLGLGPGLIRSGDMVCVLRGAEVPFILRELEGTKRTPGKLWRQGRIFCELVGECYVHGIMDGEACKFFSSETDFVLS